MQPAVLAEAISQLKTAGCVEVEVAISGGCLSFASLGPDLMMECEWHTAKQAALGSVGWPTHGFGASWHACRARQVWHGSVFDKHTRGVRPICSHTCR